MALSGVDQDAEGEDRVKNARFVVEFWGPDKPTQSWRFDLDLDGVLKQLEEVKTWLWQNETGRAPTTGSGLSAAGAAFERMSGDTQADWKRRQESSEDEAAS